MSSGSRTTFIPPPTTPATALMITGYPIESPISCASSAVPTGSTVPQQRQARLLHQVAGDRLVADLLHHVGLRADEGDPLVGADLGEVGSSERKP